MKVRHLLIGTSLLAAMTLSAQAHQGNFSGFYAGAQYGTMHSKADLRANTEYYTDERIRPGDITTKLRYNRNVSTTNVIGGLHAGYGKQFSNSFYLGIEAYGNLSNHLAQTSFKDFEHTNINELYRDRIPYERNLKLERKNTLGITLRPGIVFGNTLLYAKLGIESAHLSLQDDIKDRDTLYRDDIKIPSSTTHKRVYGFVPGIGASFKVTDHVLLGLEVTHALYKNTTFNLSKKNSKASLKSQTYNEFFARISYKW
jgi:outer membrane immunogenic protein